MSPRLDSVKSRIETLVALARLFERVDHAAGAAGADQYRALVLQLKAALASEVPERALHAVLDACPSTAELYENMHYDESGLSRSPLERSVATEMLASEAIHRASRSARGDAA